MSSGSSSSLLSDNFYIYQRCPHVLCTLKNCLWKLAFLALFVAEECTLNSLKAQWRFAYCALVLLIAFCFCDTRFLKLRTHSWVFTVYGVGTIAESFENKKLPKLHKAARYELPNFDVRHLHKEGFPRNRYFSFLFPIHIFHFVSTKFRRNILAKPDETPLKIWNIFEGKVKCHKIFGLWKKNLFYPISIAGHKIVKALKCWRSVNGPLTIYRTNISSE